MRTACLLGLTVAAGLVLGCGDDDDGDAMPDGGAHAGGDAAAGDDAGAEPSDAGGAVEDAGRDGGAGRDGDEDGGESAGAGTDAGTDAGADAGATLTLEDLCPMLIDAACEWFKRCRSASDCSFGPPNLVRSFCETGPAAVEAGTLLFRPELADACLAAHETGDCIGRPPFVDGFAQFTANGCTGIVTGTVANGQDCYPNDVTLAQICADGYCKRDANACPGTCTAYAGEDEACGVDQRCDPSLYCSTTGTCKAARPLGAACDPAQDERCQAGFYCDGASCVMRIAEGGACDDGGQCISGLGCLDTGDGVTKVCSGRYLLGDACSFTAACNYPLLCIDMKCSDAKVAPGDACLAHENCPDGYVCHGGENPRTCVVGKTSGDECGYSSECLPGTWCTTTPSDGSYHCYAPGTAGEECDPRSCAEGFFCDATDHCSAGTGEGEACDPATLEGECPIGLLCMSDGECHFLEAEGQPCNGLLGTSCVEGLFCDRATQTCSQPVGANEPCYPEVEASCTEGLFCDCPAPCEIDPAMNQAGQVCVAKLENGKACTSSVQCASGYCVDVCADPQCKSTP